MRVSIWVLESEPDQRLLLPLGADLPKEFALRTWARLGESDVDEATASEIERRGSVLTTSGAPVEAGRTGHAAGSDPG